MGAMIIIMVILTLAGTTNYVVKKEPLTKFYDFGKELNLESAYVVDYGIYNSEDIPTIIDEFTTDYISKYAQEKEKDIELVFIYGNNNSANVSVFKPDTTGEIIITLGGNSISMQGAGKYMPETYQFGNVEETIKVNILGKDYYFDLERGENFFFVIAKNTTEEIYIDKSIEN